MNSVTRAVLIVLAAVVVMSAVIGGYVYINQKPPAAVGQIESVQVSPIHSQMRVGEGAQGVQGGLETYDQLFVFTKVKIHNQGKIPLFLSDMAGTLTMRNGEQQRSLNAGQQDFDKVFVAYPQLASFRAQPVPRDITISPGQTVEGLMLFHYPITPADWDARQGFVVNVSFIHQKNLVLEAKR
ncbi:MAG: hypothetical protein HIU87_01230 [Acidobacteria bacterium]|nr:hypothetical protein [Acidobacteriota bacterium]